MLTKLVVLIATTVGGAIGWWAGAKIGLMTAFFVSMVGTGLGLYYGKRIANHYEI